MDLYTTARTSSRHADLIAEADAARLAGRESVNVGAVVRRTGAQIAAAVANLRSPHVATTPRRSAAHS